MLGAAVVFGWMLFTAPDVPWWVWMGYGFVVMELVDGR